MKHTLIASIFAAGLLGTGAVSAAENAQPAVQVQQAQQTQPTQAQQQVQAQAQPGPVTAQQTTTVAPVYEVPGRVNRAGSIYFGQ
ncbi:hypothetical protein [Pandoraea pulmonicola]|uniref:Uncharacterized protein n=1 Tax=Pandoraea pulmonicola TaxID=93221 RepID=A0AAJ4ZD00_PANPU|nr:hypothetical protein [Pandoraea pulmonicola]AJC20555.1 hypothetical protein RO07_08860 [Pandoraea pulmonicola]SUA90999.1 Uncharacterised protein [Pandoraea pulmonicola]